jgi:hypothetical protein
MVSLLSHRPQFAQGGCVVATLIVTLAQPQNQTRRDWRDIRTRTGGDVESEKHGLIVTHGTISVGFWASPSRNSGAEPVYALPTQDSSPEIPVLMTTGRRLQPLRWVPHSEAARPMRGFSPMVAWADHRRVATRYRREERFHTVPCPWSGSVL